MKRGALISITRKARETKPSDHYLFHLRANVAPPLRTSRKPESVDETGGSEQRVGNREAGE